LKNKKGGNQLNVFATDETLDNNALHRFHREIVSEADDYLRGKILTGAIISIMLRTDHFYLAKEAAYYRKLLTDLKDCGNLCDRIHRSAEPLIGPYVTHLEAVRHCRKLPDQELLGMFYYFHEEGKVRMFGSELVMMLRMDENYLKKEKCFLEEMQATISLHRTLLAPVRKELSVALTKLMKLYVAVEDVLADWRIEDFQPFCDDKRRHFKEINRVLSPIRDNIGFDEAVNYLVIGLSADDLDRTRDRKIDLLGRLAKDIAPLLEESKRRNDRSVPIKCRT
jgi:hypothetical protein